MNGPNLGVDFHDNIRQEWGGKCRRKHRGKIRNPRLEFLDYRHVTIGDRSDKFPYRQNPLPLSYVERDVHASLDLPQALRQLKNPDEMTRVEGLVLHKRPTLATLRAWCKHKSTVNCKSPGLYIDARPTTI
jgi:hypothetical protein